MSLINVICANYNNSEALRETIESYCSQSYLKKRLIIIDGGSKDGIDEIVLQYRNSIDYFISESDKGISDAFNKGVQQCLPGYVYFLGAGDCFVSFSSMEKLVAESDYSKELLVCGKIRRVDSDTGEEIGVFPKSNEFSKGSLLFRMSLPHQGLLTSTLFFDKYGVFDTTCKYAMDYEILLRAYSDFPQVTMRDVVVASWMSGGVGAGKTLEVLKEYNRIKRKNRITNGLILSLLHIFTLGKFGAKKVLRMHEKWPQ